MFEEGPGEKGGLRPSQQKEEPVSTEPQHELGRVVPPHVCESTSCCRRRRTLSGATEIRCDRAPGSGSQAQAFQGSSVSLGPGVRAATAGPAHSLRMGSASDRPGALCPRSAGPGSGGLGVFVICHEYRSHCHPGCGETARKC